MIKAECFSKGCPFIGKQHHSWISYKNGVISTNETYICWKCGKDIKKVKECPNKD